MMIRCELGIGAMLQAAKLSFLRAAIAEVVLPGERANVSRLAVVTGMTRKEVASLLEYSTEPLSPQKKPLEQRAMRVLRGWTTDPLFLTRTGRPIDLKLQGDPPTFASLVRSYGGDVTTRAVLRELERANAVVRDRSGKLHVRPRSVRGNPRSEERLLEFSQVLRDFAGTVSQTSIATDPPLYFGFRESRVANATQAALFQRTFSKRAASLLESVEQWRNRHVAPPRRRVSAKDMGASVGIGIYLFEREPSSVQRRSKRAH
jgi:hypothetical protein